MRTISTAEERRMLIKVMTRSIIIGSSPQMYQYLLPYPPYFEFSCLFIVDFLCFFSITKESFNIKICYNNTKVLSYQNYTHTIPEESL